MLIDVVSIILILTIGNGEEVKYVWELLLGAIVSWLFLVAFCFVIMCMGSCCENNNGQSNNNDSCWCICAALAFYLMIWFAAVMVYCGQMGILQCKSFPGLL